MIVHETDLRHQSDISKERRLAWYHHEDQDHTEEGHSMSLRISALPLWKQENG